MADKHDVEGSTSSNVKDGGSDSTVELNVKTLNSQNYHFNVDKNITVLAFKEKIVGQVGLPVAQQRLIFRGKVLKDNDLLSDYHVESGHTLHLVERQSSQPQPSSGATSGLNNTNDGPRNRVGHISHSVNLGTLNVGDQGAVGVPDINRVIGAVLNSIGLGNVSEGSRSGTGTQGEAGNQSFTGPTIAQAVQIPVAIPTLNTPIPNSLTTLFEFMNHMERAFAQNANDTGELPSIEFPTNSNGGATLEGLSIILRQAARLIDGRIVAALSHIAGRLEQEAGSTDISIRQLIQVETERLGLEMQHLGALFLELGRTILTTRLGRSLGESSVNSGPAVYISSTRPNPLMVQPSPMQTGSLFGDPTSAPPNTASGNLPRNLNIHIHAVGMRGANGEGFGDSGQTQAVPVRNVTTTSTTSQPASISISSNLGTSPDEVSQSSQSSSATPLGLGLGGLEPKGRSRQSKIQAKSGETSSQEQARAVGQQVLQSLASFGNRQSTENVVPRGTHNTDGQVDIADTMSDMLQNPALDGLLAGVSQQAGIGSPDALRTMIGELTQSPTMRNTINEIAQEMDINDLGSMLAGMGSGQGGGFDLSRMMQQMMPIVSQALGGDSSFGQTTHSQRVQSRPMRDTPLAPTTTQVDLQRVTRRIEEMSPPQEIFRSLIENAVNLDGLSNQETSLNELCSEDGLVNEFMHMLREDVSRRLDI